MSDLISGAYARGGSVVHRASEKLKLLLFVLAVVLTVACKSPLMYGINIGLAVLCIALSRLSVLKILGFFKRLWLFFVIIILMNMLFLSGESLLFSLGRLSASREGLVQGLKIALNTSLILVWANILLTTTSPIELMQGIGFYLKPLSLLHIKTDELALIISIAMRFIPLLLEEAQSIKKAQTARGAGFESKNPLKKATAALSLVVPVFVSAFRRAEELSQAMEARGYRGSDKDEK